MMMNYFFFGKVDDENYLIKRDGIQSSLVYKFNIWFLTNKNLPVKKLLLFLGSLDKRKKKLSMKLTYINNLTVSKKKNLTETLG
jgi:hypothetical protein